jgi:hypothetical protein
MTNPNRVDPDDLDGTVNTWLALFGEQGELAQTSRRRCRVCTEPAVRELVNHMLAIGRMPEDILRTLEGHNQLQKSRGLPLISRHSISNHKRQHFDDQVPAKAVYRRMLEVEAIKQGLDTEENVASVLTNVAYMQVVREKAFETLISDDYKVTPAMGMTAAQTLQAWEKDAERGQSMAQVMSEVGKMISVVRQFVPPESWPALQAALTGQAALPEARQADSSTPAVRVIDVDDAPDPDE